MKKIFFIVFLFAGLSLSAQTVSEFPKGLGLDIEIGHNQMDWQIDYYRTSRNEVNVSFSGKLFYKVNIFGNFYLQPFFGYMRFGGKSPVQTNGYEDEVKIDAWQTGFLFLYNTGFFGIDLGVGYKAKSMISATLERYGEFEGQEGSRQWTTENIEALFDSWTHNVGFRVGLNYEKFIFGLETWVSVGDIKNQDYFDAAGMGEGSLSENHYRFTIGFVL